MTKKRAKEIAKEVMENALVMADDHSAEAPELLGEYEDEEEGEPVEVSFEAVGDGHHAIIEVDGTKFKATFTVKEIK